MVKDGYKQTEIGVIPEDWIVETAGNIVESSAPICYGVVQVGRNTDNGVPIVAIKFIKEIAYAPLHRTATALEKPYARSRVKTGDVLISIKGTIGRVGIVPERFEGNISREIARLRLNENFLPLYIAHQLESGLTQERISKAVVGTTRLELSIATLRKFEIPIPPTRIEQQAIAQALSDVDALITSLDKLIAKKRAIKTATMQQLLTGKKRLPGFGAGRGYKQTEIGLIPEDWSVAAAEEICELIVDCKNRTPPVINGEEFAVVRTSNVRDGQFINEDLRFTDKHSFEKWTARTVPQLGDILITREAPLGEVCLVPKEFKVCLGQRMMLYRPNLNKTISVYALMSEEVRSCLLKKVGGSTVGHAKVNDIRTLEIPLPTLYEQRAIATVLSDMDAEIVALENRLAKTQAIKQGMMQELLTGRTRLV